MKMVNNNEEKIPLLTLSTLEKSNTDNWKRVVHPGSGNCVTRFTFSWLWPLLTLGSDKIIEDKDLWDLYIEDKSSHVKEKLREKFYRHEKKKIPLTKAIRQAFGYQMYLAGACKLTGDLLSFIGPLCIHEIVLYIEDPSTAWFIPEHYGIILSLIWFLASILQTMFIHQHHYLVIREAVRVRTALTMLVYEKALRISSKSKSTMGTGRIINLATTDANRVLDLFFFIHYSWASPLQLSIGLLLLIKFLGYAALAGITIMIILLPTSAAMSSWSGNLSKVLLEFTDKRIKLLSELFQGVRIVKFYAWEKKLVEVIHSIRNSELMVLRKILVINAISQLCLQAGPILVALSSFAAFALIEHEALTPEKAFTAIALFVSFRLPLMMLPRMFQLFFQAKVSIDRLEDFLQLEELKNVDHAFSSTQEHFPSKTSDGKPFGMQDVSFILSDEAMSNASMENITINIPKGKLTVIVGAVGSGKSVLLSGLIGETEPIKGLVPRTRSIAYASQEVYIINATIRENITFGAPYDQERLKKVIKWCELESDLKNFPGGVESEVGERGVTLSGGQKQRVSIARAIYPIKELYLFDDCLSALDRHVSKNIFAQCLSEKGALQGKTRVLATHAVHFARYADQIIVMDKLKLVETGSFDDLVKKPNGIFAKMYKTREKSHIQNDISSANQACLPEVVHSNMLTDLGGSKGKVIEIENKAKGTLSFKVYMSYLSSCGILFVLVAIFLLVISQLFLVSNDLWLSVWTNDHDSSDRTVTYYLKIYAFLSICTILVTFIGDLSCRFSGWRASKVIHIRLLERVVRGSMRFFDTTPIGRILNRFSNDMNTIDQKLNASIVSTITVQFGLVSKIAVQCVATPFLLIFIFPVSIIYRFVQQFYRKTSRELQRLDSVSKSPIFAHFTQTLGGLATIRAFEIEAQVVSEQQVRIDANTKAYLLLNCTNRWLGVRLEFLGAFITFAVAFFVGRYGATISSGLGGLVLSYSQSITSELNWLVRNTVDMENNMNSIERTDEYSSVEVEPFELDEAETAEPPRPSWPEAGHISFTSVFIKYRKDTDPVLKEISIDINGGEKVGVCGRTGAGKSTVMLTLFRLVECHSGKVTIDGIDIRTVSLFVLRSRIAIIPQEPVLFAATVRFNLDPFNNHTDDELWIALKKSHLSEFISALPQKLETEVLESGTNFSVGERQLLCLARAILKNSKILCLDEATASMDHSTDELIQQSISEEFAQSTVITIAHRLETILNYDRILVLKDGRVCEFDTPVALRQRPVC